MPRVSCWGRPLDDSIQQDNHVAGIGINGDGLPSAQNRLELSSEMDETGMPKRVIHFSYGENERRMSAHAERFMTEAWAAAALRSADAFLCR